MEKGEEEGERGKGKGERGTKLFIKNNSTENDRFIQRDREGKKKKEGEWTGARGRGGRVRGERGIKPSTSEEKECGHVHKENELVAV